MGSYLNVFLKCFFDLCALLPAEYSPAIRIETPFCSDRDNVWVTLLMAQGSTKGLRIGRALIQNEGHVFFGETCFEALVE